MLVELGKFVIRGSATCELAFEESKGEILGPRGAGFAEILALDPVLVPCNDADVFTRGSGSPRPFRQSERQLNPPARGHRSRPINARNWLAGLMK